MKDIEKICCELKEYLLSPNQKIDKKRITELFMENFKLNGFPLRPVKFMKSHKEGYIYTFKKSNNIAWNVARSAAWGAAWDAARDAAKDAARDAAWDAARSAARDAMRDAARSAMRGAVWNAASDAAWDAARDAAWNAARSAMRVATKEKFFKGYIEIYKEGLFSFWILTNEIVCVCNPKISRNAQGQAHNDHKEAILWENGEKYYFLNGVQVPCELVETPTSALDANKWIKEKNAEIRAQFILKYGVNRLKKFGKSVEKSNVYELMDMSSLFINRENEYSPFLFMKNPSTGTIHCEGVESVCKTILQALNWRNQSKDMPIILT